MNVERIKSTAPLSFKGWDACRIKNLYGKVDMALKENDFVVCEQLEGIAREEGFGLKVFQYMGEMLPYMQDAFIINGKNKILAYDNPIYEDIADGFARQLNFRMKISDLNMEGGNVFLGKNSDGETIALVGERSGDEAENEAMYNSAIKDLFGNPWNFIEMLLNAETQEGRDRNTNKLIQVRDQHFAKSDPEAVRQKAAEALGLEPKNVYVVPQPNYHLDTFMRPIGYPYILVNDPEYAIKNLEELKKDSSLSANYIDNLIKSTKRQTDELYQRYGQSVDDVVDYLTAQGFKPIRIGAIYGEGKQGADGSKINFINAIVNKRDDGLGYITNGTSQSNKVETALEKLFEKQLREKTPDDVRKVYFLRGMPMMDTGKDSMVDCLTNGAGVHCMVNEEPDFEVWG